MCCWETGASSPWETDGDSKELARPRERAGSLSTDSCQSSWRLLPWELDSQPEGARPDLCGAVESSSRQTKFLAVRPVCGSVRVGQVCPEMGSVEETWISENQEHPLQTAWPTTLSPQMCGLGKLLEAWGPLARAPRRITGSQLGGHHGLLHVEAMWVWVEASLEGTAG